MLELTSHTFRMNLQIHVLCSMCVHSSLCFVHRELWAFKSWACPTQGVMFFSWVRTLVLYKFNPLNKGLFQMSSFYQDIFFLSCSNATFVMCLLGCILSGTATVGIFFNLLDTVGLFEASKFWKLVGSCFCYRQNSQRALEFWGSDIVWRKEPHLRSYHPFAKTLVWAGPLSLSLQVKVL